MAALSGAVRADVVALHIDRCDGCVGFQGFCQGLKVAVQAKDVDRVVPLNELTNFYFMAKAVGSPLHRHVERLVVATNETTPLPPDWEQCSGADHVTYTSGQLKAGVRRPNLRNPQMRSRPSRGGKTWSVGTMGSSEKVSLKSCEDS